MAYSLEPMTEAEREPVIDIFNDYIGHSFAAFPETLWPYEAFDRFRQMSQSYPAAVVKDGSGKTVGFGMLRPHHPLPVFSRTAEITYFIDRHHTGRGLGKMLLDFLEREGREKGVATILANISSLNEGSIRFHRRNGFKECGRFEDIGEKHGRVFSAVWMQKMLQPPS